MVSKHKRLRGLIYCLAAITIGCLLMTFANELDDCNQIITAAQYDNNLYSQRMAFYKRIDND